MLAAYVTGHGFGHSTRTAEVLRVVRELDPALPIVVTTSAPFHLFEETVAPPLRLRQLECDVGLVQRDALTIDEAATAERWTRFARVLPERVKAEADFLRSARVRVVLGDVPPLAFAAATEAGVPSVALANFSWDWIYRHYASRHPALGDAAEVCAKAYASCSLLLRLPFACDLAVFPRIEDIPLVARRPSVSRLDARRRLALPSGPLALLSFGGVALPGFAPEALSGLGGLSFFMVGAKSGAAVPAAFPENVSFVPYGRIAETGLRFEDVVGAADVVVTKPGYGIVSDAIGAGVAIVYTERGDFPEYEVLVEGMRRFVPCAYVSNEDLLAGRLRGPIEAVLRAPMPEPPPLDGATVAAKRLITAAASASAS